MHRSGATAWSCAFDLDLGEQVLDPIEIASMVAAKLAYIKHGGDRSNGILLASPTWRAGRVTEAIRALAAIRITGPRAVRHEAGCLPGTT